MSGLPSAPRTGHLGSDDLAYVEAARRAAGRLGVRGEGPDPSRDALSDLDDLLPLDADPPATAAQPAVRVVKSTVKRLVRWYVGYLAAQVTAFGEATLRLGTRLADRLDDLDVAVRTQAERVEGLERRLESLENPPASGP